MRELSIDNLEFNSYMLMILVTEKKKLVASG